MKMRIWRKSGNGVIKGDYAPHNIEPNGSLWEVVFDNDDNRLAIREKCVGQNVNFEDLTEEEKANTRWYNSLSEM